MQKSVLDMTESLIHQQLGLSTSESRDVQGIFVVKLRAQKTDSHYLNTQLPLNEDGKNLDKQLSYINYKGTVRKLHNKCWKTVITLLLMFLCLVMDVVSPCVLSSLLRI